VAGNPSVWGGRFTRFRKKKKPASASGGGEGGNYSVEGNVWGIGEGEALVAHDVRRHLGEVTPRVGERRVDGGEKKTPAEKRTLGGRERRRCRARASTIRDKEGSAKELFAFLNEWGKRGRAAACSGKALFWGSI